MKKNQELITFLSKHITEKRFSLFQKVIQNRTRYLTVVLEDIYQSHNASAVLRTCDCFGIQDVHVVENYNKFDVNPNVSLGASKWLSLKHYNSNENNTLQAINALKEKGYRIIATTLHDNNVSLEDFNLYDGKSAIVFGTELKGISDVVKENADVFLKIPMYGFTESFNISVSAAITLHHLTLKLRSSEVDWCLNEDEREALILEWLKTSIKGGDILEKTFFESNKF